MDALNVEVLAVIAVNVGVFYRMYCLLTAECCEVVLFTALATTFPAGWTLIRTGMWGISAVPALLTSIPGLSRLTVSFISTCCSVCSSFFTASWSLSGVSSVRFYHLDLGRLTCHFLELTLCAFICMRDVECSR